MSFLAFCCRNTGFTLTATYTDDSPVPEGFDRVIGTFEIGPPPHVPTDGSKAKIKVKVSCTSSATFVIAGHWHEQKHNYRGVSTRNNDDLQLHRLTP